MDAQTRAPVAAPKKALKYIGEGEPPGGVPKSDLTAQQVTDWLNTEQYQQALDNKSHKEANQHEAAAIDKAAEAARTAHRPKPEAPGDTAKPEPKVEKESKE